MPAVEHGNISKQYLDICLFLTVLSSLFKLQCEVAYVWSHLVSCSKRGNSCNVRCQNRPIHWLAKQIATVGQWKLYFHCKHTLPHCHWWRLLFFSSNSRKKKWQREAGKSLSVWTKAVSQKKRLTVSIFIDIFTHNFALWLRVADGSFTPSSETWGATHVYTYLCIYIYIWMLVHILHAITLSSLLRFILGFKIYECSIVYR